MALVTNITNVEREICDRPRISLVHDDWLQIDGCVCRAVGTGRICRAVGVASRVATQSLPGHAATYICMIVYDGCMRWRAGTTGVRGTRSRRGEW